MCQICDKLCFNSLNSGYGELRKNCLPPLENTSSWGNGKPRFWDSKSTALSAELRAHEIEIMQRSGQSIRPLEMIRGACVLANRSRRKSACSKDGKRIRPPGSEARFPG